MKPKRRPLHIGFIDFDDIQNHLLNGGQARATYEVAKRLVQQGHKVTILCNRFPGSKDRYTDGIYYRHIGIGSNNIRLNNLFWFPSIWMALSNFHVDVIIECFTAPISTSFAPRFTRIPVVGMPTMFEAPEFSKKYHLPFDIVEALGCKSYKYFLAYSELNKQKMDTLNPNIHTRIIPNGVSEDFFSVKTKEGDYGFFIGRIDIVQKGLDLLIEACKRLVATVDIRIIIAGNGPTEEEKKLESLIKANKLEKHVSFIGRTDGKNKEDLIANCMFGMYPSRFEDFPLVPLEFASMHKPLLCFDIRGLKWVPETVALKAEAFSVDSLMKAMKIMFTDKPTRTRLAKAAQPFAKQYGWDGIATQYADYCYQILEMEGTPALQKK